MYHMQQSNQDRFVVLLYCFISTRFRPGVLSKYFVNFTVFTRLQLETETLNNSNEARVEIRVQDTKSSPYF